MSTMFIDNDQSTTFISEEKSTFVSEEKSTGMYFFNQMSNVELANPS
jgi:hypothetical protein